MEQPKGTTFTAAEMEALRVLVKFAAGHCGGGEDTIGAILYTGAARHLVDKVVEGEPPLKYLPDGAVCRLAEKIDGRQA